MTTLLVGTVEYLSEDQITKAFPEERLIALGNLAGSSKKIRQIAFNDSIDLPLLLKSYDISQIIYFSDSLNALSAMDAELHRLRKILDSLSPAAPLAFLYVTGPDLHYQNETSRSIIMASTEKLCRHYAKESSFSLKILRSLYLYDVANEQDYLGRLVAQSVQNQAVDVRVNPNQKAYYIYVGDLLALCYRVLDSWDDSFECLSMSDYFHLSYSEFIKQLNLTGEGIFSEELPVMELVVDGALLKERYGWFPKISPAEDLADFNYQTGRERLANNVSWLFRTLRHVRSQTIVIKMVEFFLLFSISEYFSHVLGQQVYFKTVDYRLFFVMTAGFLFGTNLGLLAALLATVGLVVQNINSGASNVATLFFEPSNWIPYMVYFISAMISGFVKEKGKGELAVLQNENDDLSQQLEVEKHFVEDLLADKAELAHQILGRQDSYGKIYHFLTRLETPYQDVFMMNLVHYLSEVFETDAISVYAVQQKKLTQLEFSIRVSDSQTKQDSGKGSGIFSQMEENGIWVNHHLREGYPTYMAALTDGGDIQYCLLIQDVPMEKMNLYHENLFKVLMGLADQSYQQFCLLSSRRQTQSAPVLGKEDFYQKLLAVKEMNSRYFYGQVLCLSVPSESLPSLMDSRHSIFDTLGVADGDYYLLFNARAADVLSDWKKELQQFGIIIKAIQSLEETIEDIQFSQEIG